MVVKDMYYDFKCDTCGFICQEHLADYQCPVCGSLMRTKTKKKGFKGPRDKKFTVYFFEFWILGSIAFAYFPIGTVVAIILFLITRKLLNDKYRDKAIRLYSTDVMAYSWKNYTCGGCGRTFQGQRPNCPYCGTTLNYNE